MLINYTFENFRSFEERTSFTMVPSKVRDHQRSILTFEDGKKLLKYSSIYGANASGKSNFITSVGMSRFIILNQNDRGVIPWSLISDEGSLEKPISFDYEILVDGRVYSYGFSLDLDKRVVSKEWLYDLTDKETVIYTVVSGQDFTFNNEYYGLNEKELSRMEIYIEDYTSKGNVLFLTEINDRKKKFVAKNGSIPFESIYNWFENVLEVVTPNRATKDSGVSFTSEAMMKLLTKFLRANGTGITDIGYEEIDEDEMIIGEDQREDLSELLNDPEERSQLKQVMIKYMNNIYRIREVEDSLIYERVYFMHNNNKKLYLHNESDGTIRLIDIFSILTSMKPKVFLLDEIDRSLHPLLTKNFVNEFLQKDGKSQLIVTTHENVIMDLDLIRRDQIWFLEKNSVGNSELYSLEKFKVRNDKSVDVDYFEGRYKAVPNLQMFINDFNEYKELEDMKKESNHV